MFEVRCCCKPENLVGLLPAGFPYEMRYLDDDSIAYVSGEMPVEVKTVAAINLASRVHKKRKGKTWRKDK